MNETLVLTDAFYKAKSLPNYPLPYSAAEVLRQKNVPVQELYFDEKIEGKVYHEYVFEMTTPKQKKASLKF